MASSVEEGWRQKKLLADRAKRDREKQALEEKGEIAAIEAVGKAQGALEQRGRQAQQDAAREDRVRRFYAESRYGSLLDARGRDDPMVQSAGRELGYDAGGLGTPRRAGAVRRRGSAAGVGGIEGMTEKEKTDLDIKRYEAETDRMGKYYDADQTLTPDDLKKLIGSKSSDKTESLAKTNVSSVFGETPAPKDKIYQGTVRRGGKDYRAFSDTQREGYSEYQPTRLADPRQAPAPPPVPEIRQNMSRRAMPESALNQPALKQIETINNVLKKPAKKGQSTMGLLKQIGQSMINATPEWTKYVPFSPRNIGELSGGEGYNFMPGKDHTSTSPDILKLRELLKRKSKFSGRY